MKAKQQLESKLAKHRGPSLMLLVAVGVGGGLVVLVLLVTVALVVARRRQVHREELYRKVRLQCIFCLDSRVCILSTSFIQKLISFSSSCAYNLYNRLLAFSFPSLSLS